MQLLNYGAAKKRNYGGREGMDKKGRETSNRCYRDLERLIGFPCKLDSF